ncbi:Ubiquitin carboxyl-terminal hydrolase 12 [Bienertia sinuspersici]
MTVMTPAPIDQEDDEMLVPHSDIADNHQPMEVVAQAEPANNNNTNNNNNNPENQAAEDPQSSRRILIFPKGNNVDFLSMYLDVADAVNLPYGWSRYTAPVQCPGK